MVALLVLALKLLGPVHRYEVPATSVEEREKLFPAHFIHADTGAKVV